MKLDSKAYKTMFTVLQPIVERGVTITPDEDGWKIYAISINRVALVSIELGKDAFTDYEVTEPFKVDVDKALKAAKDKGDSLEIITDDGWFKVKGDGMTTKFRLEVMDEVNPRFPSKFPEGEATVPIAPLQKLLRNAESLCGEIRIRITAEGLAATAYDDTQSGSDILIPADVCATLQLPEGKTEVAAGYALKEMKDFLMVMPSGDFIKLSMDTDYPMFAEIEADHCRYKWAIAPRITSD